MALRRRQGDGLRSKQRRAAYIAPRQGVRPSQRESGFRWVRLSGTFLAAMESDGSRRCLLLLLLNVRWWMETGWRTVGGDGNGVTG